MDMTVLVRGRACVSVCVLETGNPQCMFDSNSFSGSGTFIKSRNM